MPTQPGHAGMAESLEIIAFLIARHKLVMPCASGRGDLGKYCSELPELRRPVVRPRTLKMPVVYWADERDRAYAI